MLKRIPPRRPGRGGSGCATTSAKAGPIKLVGVVQSIGGETVVGPLSGAPCVWWRVVVEQVRGSSRDDVLDVAGGCDFHLDDGSGALARVSRSAMNVALATQAADPAQAPAVAALLTARGIHASTDGMVWFEERIPVGARVSVPGVGRMADGPLQAPARERWVVGVPPGGTMLVALWTEEELRSYVRRSRVMIVVIVLLVVALAAVGLWFVVSRAW